MAFRVFLPLLLIFFLFLYVAIFNPGEARFFFAQDRFVELPYVALVMLSFMAGALSLSLVHFFKGLGELINDFSNLLRRIRAKRVEARLIKARRLALDGDLAKSLAALEKILRKNPNNFDALVAKGWVCRKAGRFDDALRAHSLALSEKPADAEVIRQIAEDYRSAGNHEAAYRMMERSATEGASNIDQLCERRDFCLQSGRLERAAELQDEILSLASDETGRRAAGLKLAEIQSLLGEQLSAEGRHEHARARFESALKNVPDFIPAGVLLGDALVALGKRAEAEEHFKKMFFQTGSLLPLIMMEKHGLGGAGIYQWGLENNSSGKADVGSLSKLAAGSKAAGYRCTVCNAVENDYLPQCPSCGAWNAVAAAVG